MNAPAATLAPAAAPVPALTPNSRLTLLPLSITPDGDGFLAGNAATATFIALPPVGVVALQDLIAGRTIGEAAATTRAHAGQDVDVLDFAATLLAVGLVEAVDDVPVRSAAATTGHSWLAGVPPDVVRPFWGRAAWLFYSLCLVGCLVLWAAYPAFWPTFEDFFFYPNPAVCVVVMTLAALVLAAGHESCHWLAARAAGVAARFSISRRLFFPVFETDLSQLWSVPRGQRYSPFLAGMAFDSVVLCGCLGLRVLWSEQILNLPPLVVRFAGAVVLTQVTALSWQALVFLRTDLYAVLITALGCFNLYRITYLTMIGKVRRLGAAEAAELAAAHGRDRQVVRWFGWLCAAGFVWAAYVFVAFFLPSTVVMAGWLWGSLGGLQITSAAFWEAFTIGAIAALQGVLPLGIWAWQRWHAPKGQPQ